LNTTLVLTNSNDGLHSEAVINNVETLGGQPIRLDVDKVATGEHKLLLSYTSTGNGIVLDTGRASYDLGSVQSVWFRRPYSYKLQIADSVQAAAAEVEFRDVLDGLWQLLSDKFWISHPGAIAKARLKPYQLNAAVLAGFKIPDTIITNNPASAIDFCKVGPTVFKPFSEYNLEYEDNLMTTLTTLITDDILSKMAIVANQPVLLQRCITKKYEVRVTCVGSELFPTLISCENFETVIDQRSPGTYAKLNYKVCEIPTEVAECIRRLISSLNLEYAAIDLAINSEGEYIFFEVNPVGQWLWIEEITGHKISETLAIKLLG